MRKGRSTTFPWTFLLLLLILAFGLYRFGQSSKLKPLPKIKGISVAERQMLEKTWLNYSDSVIATTDYFNLSPSYLLALIALENSGRAEVPSRYEPHVHRRLKQVQKGWRKQYEHVEKSLIDDAGEDALKNLASSWGPFQIMGYKCLELGDALVMDLRSHRSVYYGAKWINGNYGSLLRDERFKDAFHFHNTGRLFPSNGRSKTHDPTYVERGLLYMQYFQEKILRGH